MSAHRSAAIMYTNQPGFAEPIADAKLRFDQLWQCAPDDRPFNLTRVTAQPEEKGGWTIMVEAEDA